MRDSPTKVQNLIIRALLTTLGLVFFCITVQPAFAANTIMSVSPTNGSFGKAFSVDVVIDGHGDAFNASQATVVLSPNLALKELTLGDCNFSFITTPGIANPSFAGVLLGKSSKKCTVYTMTLIPTAKGNASVSFTNASVRRYGDAVKILSSVQNGTYTLTAALTAPTTTIVAPQGNIYAVVLRVLGENAKPVTATEITLKSAHASLHATTDATGEVRFPNIQKGVYDALATNYTGDTILNVSGNNHVLVLTIKVQKRGLIQTIQNAPWFMTGLIAAGILLVGGFIGLIIWTKREK